MATKYVYKKRSNVPDVFREIKSNHPRRIPPNILPFLVQVFLLPLLFRTVLSKFLSWNAQSGPGKMSKPHGTYHFQSLCGCEDSIESDLCQLGHLRED